MRVEGAMDNVEGEDDDAAAAAAAGDDDDDDDDETLVDFSSISP